MGVNKKRTFQVGLAFFVVFLILISRLAYIQLIATQSFSSENINLLKAAVRQRTEGFKLNDGRGVLLDRHGRPMRDERRKALILFPFLKETHWPYKKVAEIVGVPAENLLEKVKAAQVPFALPQSLTKQQVSAVRMLHIPGVYAETVQSQEFDPFAEHILGLVAENSKLVKERYPEKLRSGVIEPTTKIGISGLEEAFDPFLVSRGTSKLIYHTEANGSPLFGLQVRFTGPGSPYYPLSVKTTLDKHLQMIVQQAVDEAGLEKGGAVLLDARTNTLLAMVSRPKFDPHHPYDRGAKNYMILPQIPGSVFKIVTAAAAIETGAIDPDRQFNCDTNLYGGPNPERKLGQLTFAEGFAESCNRVFGQLATEIADEHPNYIETYAKRLGMLGPVGWRGTVYRVEHLQHFPNEVPGQIWEDESYKQNPKSVAQTAIGQLNVRISPLAAANAVATIARGGEKAQVRAATEILYKNGTPLAHFEYQLLPGDTISSFAAMRLQSLMRKVVTEGTGHRLSRLPYTVAGKSGTAQTGGKNSDVNNQWFAGYFPADNPRYVLVVVDLHRTPGQVKTYEIYSQIVKQLFLYDQKKVAKTIVSPNTFK
ncbi:MAG TPA: penicillin-binding protein 2 [Bacillales bacterium]|nr:penicillin-binding protein 2 [Bacillales bacterium]